MDTEATSLHHTSNVPGLGDFSSPTDEDKYGKNRKWVRETDSDYVKLAKQGGHRGLLNFEDEDEESALSGNNRKNGHPSWLANEPTSEDSKQTSQWAVPDYMHHNEFQKNIDIGDYQQLRAPFGTDSETPWERKKEDWTMDSGMLRRPEFGRRQQRDLNASTPTQVEGLSVQVDQQGKMQQAGSPTQARNEPVSMQKLLSFGYAEDWHTERNEKERKEQEDIDLGECQQV